MVNSIRSKLSLAWSLHTPLVRKQRKSHSLFRNDLVYIRDIAMMGLESEEKVDLDPKIKADRVRRNLFGPVDHEQLQEDFQRLLWTSIEVAREKWNFDFIREIPASGTLEWEELSCQDVPAFYRSCVIRGRKHLQGLQQQEQNSSSQQPGVQAQERKSIQGTPQPKKRRQTCMTDYYSAKRRCTSEICYSSKE